jgi:glycine cleavage system H lipoate-binding protein
MAVILVLCTFAVFLTIDAILSRKKTEQMIAAPEPVLAAEFDAEYVDGFHVPAGFQYHPGHAWAQRERRNVIRVGVDEFAAKLAGRIDQIELPKPGHWIRQGQKAWTLSRGEEKAEMLSPVEGEVVEINHELVNNPSLMNSDPYGKGWLFSVFAPDEESTMRNLLPGDLVSSWMRETANKLYGMQPALAGAVMADGGRPADDLSAAIPNTPWKELTGEFFLTK